MHRKLLAIGAAAAAVFLVTGMASPRPATEAAVGPITDVSHACSGQNAEVELATWHQYVYVDWMGCDNSIGFSRSADGGRTWSAPVVMPGSPGGSWDPAVTVSPEGVLYVSFMNSNNTYTYPVVDASFDSGRTFTEHIVHPPDQNNWGDRDFIAAGPHGVVYLTWDYGPDASVLQYICAASGSCAFANGDLNVVIEKSTDYGRTWGPMVHVSPGFPASGGDSGPLLVEPNGRIDMSYQGYDIYNLKTYAMSPAYTYFTSSTDGGTRWSPPVQVGPSAGTMSLGEWWIDGAISSDTAGNLYVTWDTQGIGSDTGWLSYSADHGRTWSAPIRVTPDRDNATHIVQSAGGAPGVVYVGWLADSSSRGYALYLRTFAIGRGWLSGPQAISVKYGNSAVWPGDTFGIATGAGKLMLSWGSAVGGATANSEIFAAPVTVGS